MQAVLDVLLTRDVWLRTRPAQSLMAMAMMTAGIAAMHYFVAVGLAPREAVGWWTVVALGGMVVSFLLIRSGWTQRLPDPSFTVPQMLYAIGCAAWAYALLGTGRGAVFPIVMVILMFGLFMATPRQMALVSVYAVAVFGATMAFMAARMPAVYTPAVEGGHFLLVATMMPAVSILAARLGRLRHRSRQQRAELERALARIRELATRDELTGLYNRRHLQELMEQEHQRCVRSGHTFCVAVLGIEDFQAQVAGLGEGGHDALLHGVAVEAQRFVRTADVLAYWGDDRFVLLMSNARAPLARGGLNRLCDQVADARVLPTNAGLRVRLRAGLAEHHAGETVDQTLERAEAALLQDSDRSERPLAAAL
jgi:diguanylate cyclase (GGDEF)-like protein